MRIADNMTFEQVKDSIGKNRSEMSQLQNKAATQKRVTKPSDDPVAAARVLGTKVDLQAQMQFVKNINYANSFLQFTDQSLEELTNQLVRAKELALSQSNDASANDQSRKVVAEEVGQIYKQMVLIGNRKFGDRHIFGGFNTVSPPFSFDGDYRGDKGEMLVNVDKGSYLAMNVPGSKVFLGEGLSRDGITHTTSVQAQTIEEYNEQKAMEEAMSTQPSVDTEESEPAGVRSPASLESSLTSGATTAENSKVQALKEAGYDLDNVAESTGRNLFKTIKTLEVALKTNDKATIQDSLDELDQALDQVVLARSQVGSRMTTVNSTMETLNKAMVDSKGMISQLEDANIYELVSDINKAETTLKATLATSGKMMQPSLMDFLR